MTDNGAAPAVSITGLTKIYGKTSSGRKTALDNLTLEVPRGSFTALLGPNGAGKSTCINILAGLVNPTSGKAEICGYDVVKKYRKARMKLGVVPQELVLDPFFPPFEALENYAAYYGIPKKKRRTAEIIEAVGLTDKARSPARKLSGGMRRRLLVAKALVHSPEVLILDEPTAGVDVDLRNQLWDYVRSLNEAGVTVILTTHYLEEAQELCDRIAIINQGKLIADESKDTLMRSMSLKKLTVVSAEPYGDIPDDGGLFNAVKLESDTKLTIEYDRQRVSFNDALAFARCTGADIIDIAVSEADLEDIFLHLTKKGVIPGNEEGGTAAPAPAKQPFYGTQRVHAADEDEEITLPPGA